MSFINTKILLAILAAVTVIASAAVSWDNQNQEDQARMEVSEAKKKSDTITFDPDKVAPPLTAEDLFN
jgi:hypothetical protein